MGLETSVDFAARYAAFLAAAHTSFPKAKIRLPSLWQRLRGRRLRKPWREVLDAALSQAGRADGVILEFGVHRGYSIRHMAARRPGAALHGFDSFQGFPADQRQDWHQDFALPAVPEVPENVRLHVGYFEETLPRFVTDCDWVRPALTLVHIDCDIFSSTQTVLLELEPWLGPGDILVFDELMNYAEFAVNEFLALFLFLERTGLDFEWLATWGKPYPWSQAEGLLPAWGFDAYRAAGYFQNQAIRLIPRTAGGHFDGPAAGQSTIERLKQALAAVKLPDSCALG